MILCDLCILPVSSFELSVLRQWCVDSAGWRGKKVEETRGPSAFPSAFHLPSPAPVQPSTRSAQQLCLAPTVVQVPLNTQKGELAPARTFNNRRLCISQGERKPTPRSVPSVSIQDSNAIATTTGAAAGSDDGGRSGAGDRLDDDDMGK
jgi:hypothetical protein